jgi:hypothetical protein
LSDFQDEVEGTWEPPTAWITVEGMVRCACDEWAIKRANHPHHCEHTDELRKERRLHFIKVGPYYFINDCWITDIKRPVLATAWDESLLIKFQRLVQYVSVIPAWERYMAAPLVEQVKFPIESAVLLGKCAPAVRQDFIAVNDEMHRLLMEGIPPDTKEEESNEREALPSEG